MYVCLCMGVTSGAVQQAIDGGASTTKEVAAACGAGSVCGRCRHTVRVILDAAAPESAKRPLQRVRRRWGRS